MPEDALYCAQRPAALLLCLLSSVSGFVEIAKGKNSSRAAVQECACGAGFMQQFAAVVDESKPGMHLGLVLAELSGGRKPTRVLCTGHSLGGALATLGAALKSIPQMHHSQCSDCAAERHLKEAAEGDLKDADEIRSPQCAQPSDKSGQTFKCMLFRLQA